MSRLKQLLNELCSDGVEYKHLEEVAKYSSARIDATEVNAESYIGVDNLLPDRQGKTTSNYVPSEGRLIQFVSGDILIGNIRPYLKKIWLATHSGGTNGDVLAIQIRNRNILQPKYLYYVLSSDAFFHYDMHNAKGTKMPRGDKSAVMRFRVPLPPLPVQEEIVRILDDFTELTVKLVSELTAELTARKIQHGSYRDQLMTGKDDWKTMRLIDILCQPVSDGPHTTPMLISDGIPFISVDAIWDGKIHFENKRGYITQEFDIECCKKYKPQREDVFMVKSGSTTGKVAYVDTDIRFNIWSPLAAMRVNSDNSSRFLFHLLQAGYVQEQVKAKSSHGSQPNLGMRALEQFEIKIPSYKEQLNIAEVLDQFGEFYTDITNSLTTEIKARQEQFEYYRNKLLTFKEKEVSVNE